MPALRGSGSVWTRGTSAAAEQRGRAGHPRGKRAPSLCGTCSAWSRAGGREGFARRKKTSLWFVGSLLVVSISILTVGLAATTRTENVTMGGYYPGIILGFGSFLGIIGINLVENRKQMEPRPLTAGRCQFYSSGVGYLPNVYQTEVTCHSLNGRCQLKVKSNTCYCCDLYDCQRSRCPSWPTARPQRLRSSTTPPSRSWPTRASARCPRLSPPARRTRCPSSPLAASRPHLAPTFLCPRVCSLRPSPAPAAGRPPTPPPPSSPSPTSSPGRSLRPTRRDAEGGD
ncbi:transmembrane protein 255B isoform X2 [Balaenoptera acutorostrata]|uniref:Transmembrane protein 255B isoform X2 n=1 Tax=Balaenoptera acutorostrata TaxID=9767 RepID=A0ABM3SG89_BALAC|nr:transmembrane protein 255B isoform X2 [Balaenoptera acutorostrata]